VEVGVDQVKKKKKRSYPGGKGDPSGRIRLGQDLPPVVLDLQVEQLIQGHEQKLIRFLRKHRRQAITRFSELSSISWKLRK